MDIRKIQYFVAVAEALNFTEAANSLYVSQSSLSRQIADLELELGIQLFVRTKQSVHLTSAGVIFLKEAKEILAKVEEAVNITRETADGFVGKLKIGFLGSGAKHFLPEFINTFHKKYPKIELDLIQGVGWEILDETINHHDCDIAFSIDFGDKKSSKRAYKRVCTIPSAIVCRKDNPLLKDGSLTIEMLANEPFIHMYRRYSPGIDFMISICERHGFEPNIIRQVSTMENVVFLIEAGIGLSILPRFVDMYTSPQIYLQDLPEEDGSIDIIAEWEKANTNPSIPLFINELEREVIGQP